MNEAKFETLSAAWTYITSGRAVLTLVSLKTGTRFTYRVRAGGRGHTFFVDLLTGPNNETDFAWQGILFQDGNYRQMTSTGCLPKQAPSIRALRWFLSLAATEADRMHPGIEVWHEGTCGRCGRRLTDPMSIETGLGPICREKAS